MWAWLSISTNIRRSRRRRLLATKLATLIQLKVVYMEVSGRTSILLQYCCMMIAVRHYARYRSTTLNKLTFFQKVLVFSDGKQSFKPYVRLFCLAFFCSASTQTVLMRTVGITEYNGHLKLKRSTAERHIETTLLRPTYSLQAAELINQDMTMI